MTAIGAKPPNQVPPVAAATADLAPSLDAAARLLGGSVVLLGLLTMALEDVFLGIVLVSVGLFGHRGFQHGLLRSVLGFCGILAVFRYSVPLGKLLAGSIDPLIDWPFVPVRQLSILIVAATLWTIACVVGWLLARWFQRVAPTSRPARLGGLIVGSAQGILLAITILSATLSLEPPARMALSLIADRNELAATTYRQLLTIRAAAEQNILGRALQEISRDQTAVLEMGGSLAVLSQFPGMLTALNRHPTVEDLRRSVPAVRRIEREIRTDRRLKAALRRGDLWSMLNTPTVLRLLDDKELAEMVQVHEGELMDAMISSVPPAFRADAFAELGRIKGVSPAEYIHTFESRLGAPHVTVRAGSARN